MAKIKDETVFYDHQIVGSRWGARINSFLNNDDQGLGKTLQALTVAAIDFELGYARRVLVVTKPTLKENFAEETAERTNFTFMVLADTPASKRHKQLAEYAESDTDILIIGYPQVAAHLDELNALDFDIVIADEAHEVKTYFGEKPKEEGGKAKKRSSQRARAFHDLKGKRFILLSGSFVLNQVDELWSPLHRIDPAGFPSYWKFVNRYAVFGGYKDKQIVGVKNEAELKERLGSVLIRREKSECLDLPPKQHIKVMVDLHPEQRRLYRQVVEELRLDLPGEPNPMEIENALTKMLRLKQICGTTATIEGYPDHSFKLDQVTADLLELAAHDHKTVVFTQFLGVLQAEKARLEKAGLPVWVLHGGVPASERVPTVKDWAASREPGVVLAMLQVAGVGLNMTASRHGLFIDKLYVPALNTQAEDRLHRIGADSTQPVQIRDYQARNTVESRIETILRRKKKLVGSLTGSSDWKRALYDALKDEEDS